MTSRELASTARVLGPILRAREIRDTAAGGIDTVPKNRHAHSVAPRRAYAIAEKYARGEGGIPCVLSMLPTSLEVTKAHSLGNHRRGAI